MKFKNEDAVFHDFDQVLSKPQVQRQEHSQK